HEEMTLIDRPARRGKCRADDGASSTERIRKGIEHRTDIPCWRRVECGAVFEQELTAPLPPQPVQRSERLLNSGRGRYGAGLQRYAPSLDGWIGGDGRHAIELHRPHAALGQGVREIGGAGEIVANATEDHVSTRIRRYAFGLTQNFP